MRIERVEAIAIEIPLPRRFAGSVYAMTTRCAVITRIRTSDGLASEVYNGDNREHGPEIVRIITEEIAPQILGEDAVAYERLWDRAHAITIPNRDRKLAMEAIACVDTAVWDLLGKRAGLSVRQLLGGYRSELPIISIGGYYAEGKTLLDLAREMEQLRAWGMGGCKVKVGGLAPEQDAERVRAALDGAGEGFLIAVDANRGWCTADAIRFARLIEDLPIAWFEEPCHWYDEARGMAEVRRATRIPVNAGQSEYTARGVRRLLDAGAVDIVNFDASEAGGITEWRRAAAACALVDVRMAHHEEPQIAAHMLAGIPHGICVECFADPARDPLWPHLLPEAPRPKDGMLAVPDRPGFGIVLDEDAVKKFTIASAAA
ncbi:mandelate racemase/muconate lactonizing enzyme family protein [Paracraurococcus lichenis]|uniref:Mandelate racemase/muconate lactonizing enzyme family protein n=1 Tax=Paracraurococcus lichenis TaxID=3064888 RepID=A0ABT9DU56_9PROT|nr:mandelate racemase/muconate lactonizing enzyme family protein [Paracraurococcus sp. LOR1-02]MDO9707432.1 mandelate racemase/muconate lactonizing enzyme family protein [Paracraurococcus sp. LOR1-02]